jgi:hypothetical protein
LFLWMPILRSLLFRREQGEPSDSAGDRGDYIKE